MRLTTFTDYGLRALMRMAADPERIFSTAGLAAEFGISRHHLAKIMQRLSGAGIIRIRRGEGGGACLAIPAMELGLGWLVRLLEDGQPLVECFATGQDRCTFLPGCRLRGELARAERAFLNQLDQRTLADIVPR